MANSDDTEITLGTGKMLALFFGLVALCAVFFGMGFSLGRNSARSQPGPATPATASAGVRPSAVKAPNGPSADLSFYKSVAQKDADPKLAASDAANSGPNSA